MTCSSHSHQLAFVAKCCPPPQLKCHEYTCGYSMLFLPLPLPLWSNEPDQYFMTRLTARDKLTLRLKQFQDRRQAVYGSSPTSIQVHECRCRERFKSDSAQIEGTFVVESFSHRLPLHIVRPDIRMLREKLKLEGRGVGCLEDFSDTDFLSRVPPRPGA